MELNVHIFLGGMFFSQLFLIQIKKLVTNYRLILC